MVTCAPEHKADGILRGTGGILGGGSHTTGCIRTFFAVSHNFRQDGLEVTKKAMPGKNDGAARDARAGKAFAAINN
jgi:hypothetical protein